MFTAKVNRRARRAFTLAEIMIGAALGSMVLAGVLTSYSLLLRSGTSAANYSTMESQTRRAFEQLGIDARMASNLTWNSETSVTLTVPNNYTSNGNKVTYAYDSTNKWFSLVPGDGSVSTGRLILVREVVSVTFTRYTRDSSVATTDSATKRLQLSINVRRSAGGSAVTENIASASFTLRNKDV
jgi:Tfp pilus assembly protein PilW